MTILHIINVIALTPKGPWLYFTKNHSKLLFLMQRVKIFENYYLGASKYRILHLTSIKMFEINFKIFDHTDCMIFVFKVKKTIFFAHCKTRLFDLNLLNLNFQSFEL